MKTCLDEIMECIRNKIIVGHCLQKCKITGFDFWISEPITYSGRALQSKQGQSLFKLWTWLSLTTGAWPQHVHCYPYHHWHLKKEGIHVHWLPIALSDYVSWLVSKERRCDVSTQDWHQGFTKLCLDPSRKVWNEKGM